MRIAFVNAEGWLRPGPWMPLGAVALCTLLARRHDVTLLDAEQFPVPDSAARDADLICVTGMSHQARGVAAWVGRARAWGKPVIVGGVHASISPREIAGAAVVAGPGEPVIERIVEDGAGAPAKILQVPELDDPDRFPVPDRRRFGWDRYRETLDGLPAIRVLGGRGCPYACRSCCNRGLTGGRVRLRAPAAIAEEIRRAQGELGIRGVDFALSVFSHDRTWALELCERLARLNVAWKATTRVDRVDLELLVAMRRSGCVALGFGVDSGDDRILRVLRKGITAEQARAAFALAREACLPTFARFMTHVPGETPETLARTRRFAAELAPPRGATFQRFSPLPGSPFDAELEQWGQVTERADGGFGPRGFVPWAFCEESAAACR